MIKQVRNWNKWCFLIAFGGLLIAALPFFIAFIGLMLGNQYLQTYHWFAYLSMPAGLIIFVFAIILRLSVWLMAKLRNST